MNMVDPLSIALGFVTAISIFAVWYYREKYKEENRRYKNMILPESLRPKEKETERKEQFKLRRDILKRDGFKCRECGFPKHLEVHHIIPKSEGGSDEPENLITLCIRCHQKTHNFENRKVGHYSYTKKYKHKHGKHHNRNKSRKEKRYFKEHVDKFVFSSVPPSNWDQMPENVKKERRNEIYEQWKKND